VNLWNYIQAYPDRLKNQFYQGMGEFAQHRNPVSVVSSLNPTSPFIQDAAVQAGGLLAPQVNALSQLVSQGSENLGLGPLSIPEVTDEQLAPFLMLGMGGRNKMGFYSPSGKALTTAPGKGQSGQYLAHLKKEPGATREAKETGLLQALEQAPGTLTKEEVVSMWNPIELTETVKGGNDFAYFAADDWQNAVLEAERDQDWELAHQLTVDWEESQGQGHGSAKYAHQESLNLPGGSNPKEILVQLSESSEAELESAKQELNEYWNYLKQKYDLNSLQTPMAGEGRYADMVNMPESEINEYKRLFQKMDSVRGQQYTGGHWSEPNVLAHIRTNERDVGGKKALHIEEIQSDWHQTGQKKGYYTGPSLEYSVSETEDGLWEIYDSGGELVEVEHTREAAEDVARQFGEGALTAAPGAGTVPDAPYKKDWHELAFKRALMEGINDPSIERLTWTTGDVQADRYNLAKYINSIEAQAVGDNFNLAVIHKDGHAQSLFQLTPDELSDHVGKEMAEKIVREKGGMYSGLDLEVGGEFHKNLYDKKITNFAKKFLKKYGVEPEKWQAPSASENPTATAKDGTSYYIGGRADGDDIWHILKEMPDDSEGKWVDDVLMETPGNMDAAREALRKYGDLDDSPYDLWYIDITPEMRQDLQQKGVPLTMNNRKPFLAYA